MSKRKKGSNNDDAGVPAWLITFSDVMTLLLTFFVLLISMASLTQQRKKELVLSSISQYFGMGSQSINILGKKKLAELIEPGPMENLDEYEYLKNLLWESLKEDVEFLENKFSYIISIQAEVFFQPGKSNLTDRGKLILNKIVPILKRLKYPLLLAGHTSTDIKELGKKSFLGIHKKGYLSPSWKLSLDRAVVIYKFLIDKGINPEKLRLEAFGKYHPRYSNISLKGRRKNQRVDIIIDKRDKFLAEEISTSKGKIYKKQYKYKGFIFKLP